MGATEQNASGRGRLIHFIANGMYNGKVAGGDLHFFEMAKAAAQVGYTVNLFGSHTFEPHLKARNLPIRLTPTDRGNLPRIDEDKLPDQFRLFWEYWQRLFRTLAFRGQIAKEDVVFATSDYWFDVLPLVLSAARRKMLVLHMEFPTLWQIVTKGRADVQGLRLASIYSWISQNSSLRLFRFCKHKQVLYLHPAMRERLLRMGYLPEEMDFVSFGADIDLARKTPDQKKEYDVIWLGRVHRQKGVEDLLEVLRHLQKRVEGFRAMIVGNVVEALKPRIKALGMEGVVAFSGFVSEAEKFRLFKASRIFLMPSLHEGSPRVIGEALACELPVVAYDVVTYRPVFGEFVRYVPCFDVQALQAEAERQVLKMRAGENYLTSLDLTRFQKENSWPETQKKFLLALDRLGDGQASAVT